MAIELEWAAAQRCAFWDGANNCNGRNCFSCLARAILPRVRGLEAVAKAAGPSSRDAAAMALVYAAKGIQPLADAVEARFRVLVAALRSLEGL